MHEPLVLWIEDVYRVDGLLRSSDLPDVAQRFLHRPRCGDRDELGRHDAAGAFRRILEQHLERSPRRGLEELQDLDPIRLPQLAHEISTLIGGHGFDERGGRLRRHAAYDAGAMSIELGLVEHLHREIEWQCGHHLGARLGTELAQRFSDIGGAHAGERFGKLGRISVQQIKQLWGSRGSRPVACHHVLGVC